MKWKLSLILHDTKGILFGDDCIVLSSKEQVFNKIKNVNFAKLCLKVFKPIAKVESKIWNKVGLGAISDFPLCFIEGLETLIKIQEKKIKFKQKGNENG